MNKLNQIEQKILVEYAKYDPYLRAAKADDFAYYNSLKPEDFKTYDDFRDTFLIRTCPRCGMEESCCICPNFDSEGNEI